jgi:hypothetical protein
MSRTVMYVLLLPLFAGELWAQFVLDDQQMTMLFAVLCLGVVAVRWVLGPQAENEKCPADCSKCRESEGEGL